MKRIVIGISGSSGSIYAKSLIEKLSACAEDVEVGIVMSPNAVTNWEIEIGPFSREELPFKVYDSRDFNAPFASGSAQYNYMVICPCSMGTLAKVANGISSDLMSRAADVILKERRKLIMLTRETPLSLIHINNMKLVTEAGGIIMPACPSFYSKPASIEEAVHTVTDRILDHLDIAHQTYRWNSDNN